MEDTHRGPRARVPYYIYVLILVLMEDTHRAMNMIKNKENKKVLILVLMEDTHRDKNVIVRTVSFGLNPCSNGRYSQRLMVNV